MSCKRSQVYTDSWGDQPGKLYANIRPTLLCTVCSFSISNSISNMHKNGISHFRFPWHVGKRYGISEGYFPGLEISEFMCMGKQWYQIFYLKFLIKFHVFNQLKEKYCVWREYVWNLWFSLCSWCMFWNLTWCVEDCLRLCWEMQQLWWGWSWMKVWCWRQLQTSTDGAAADWLAGCCVLESGSSAGQVCGSSSGIWWSVACTMRRVPGEPIWVWLLCSGDRQVACVADPLPDTTLIDSQPSTTISYHLPSPSTPHIKQLVAPLYFNITASACPSH